MCSVKLVIISNIFNIFLIFITEFGSNIINTTFRKITNWIHLATITMVHYDLVIITTMRKIIQNYLTATIVNKQVMPILFSALLLFLIGIINICIYILKN